MLHRPKHSLLCLSRCLKQIARDRPYEFPGFGELVAASLALSEMGIHDGPLCGIQLVIHIRPNEMSDPAAVPHITSPPRGRVPIAKQLAEFASGTRKLSLHCAVGTPKRLPDLPDAAAKEVTENEDGALLQRELEEGALDRLSELTALHRGLGVGEQGGRRRVLRRVDQSAAAIAPAHFIETPVDADPAHPGAQRSVGRQAVGHPMESEKHLLACIFSVVSAAEDTQGDRVESAQLRPRHLPEGILIAPPKSRQHFTRSTAHGQSPEPRYPRAYSHSHRAPAGCSG